MHSRIGLCSGFERVEIADRIVQIDHINVLLYSNRTGS